MPNTNSKLRSQLAAAQAQINALQEQVSNLSPDGVDAKANNHSSQRAAQVPRPMLYLRTRPIP